MRADNMATTLDDDEALLRRLGSGEPMDSVAASMGWSLDGLRGWVALFSIITF